MPTWQEIVADKQQRQKASIPSEWLITPPSKDILNVTYIPSSCGLLTPYEIKVTESHVEVLLAHLATGEWSSYDVTTAFYKRAIIAQQLVNCLTEIFVEQALIRAAECDRYLKENGKPIGPLHGLPVSLKDQISIKGLETTMGYVSWIGKYAEKDAVLTSILLEAGAVPFVRTNVPQTLMWPETFNNVFGRTLNPYNRNLTCGGSSGGEGALIGLKGSPLGVGSDIGGSIRIPSAFNNLYGLRPSSNRVPYEGSLNSMIGQDSLPSVLGPLSSSLSGVKVFMKAILEGKPWLKDPLALRKPWDEDGYKLRDHGSGKDLCFAIQWDNGIVKPTPPVLRALEITKKSLASKGIKVIDWPTSTFDYKLFTIALERMFQAGSREDYQATTASTGEPVITSMALAGESAGFDWKQPFTSTTAYELWQIQKQRAEMRKQHLDLWESTVSLTGTGRPVDAIITPVAPYPAPPHGQNRDVNYTMVWNGMDCPACVFPVTVVDQDLDKKQERASFFGVEDEAIHGSYDPTILTDAPVALQLVGHTHEDEAVIGMTEVVDAALKSASLAKL